jgi:uncharacterized protein DUF6064
MLPFTADVLEAVVAGYNRAIWPAQTVAYGLALLLLWIATNHRAGAVGRVGPRLLGVALAAAWAWIGLVFHLRHFAVINFAAPAYSALFLLQAALLAWSGVLRGCFVPRLAGGPAGWVGFALVGYAIVGDPAFALIIGKGVAGARVVGLAPEPTALFTLGLLLLADGRAPLHLAAIPVLWTLIAGATAWTLGMREDLVLPLLGLGSLSLILWKNRRRC